MFAVFRFKGKQYKVCEGDVVNVDLLDQPSVSSQNSPQKADHTVFNEVLLFSKDGRVKVGQPTVAGALVNASVLGEVKAKKVVAYKFKRRKGYHRTVGHRQRYTQVKITSIQS